MIPHDIIRRSRISKADAALDLVRTLQQDLEGQCSDYIARQLTAAISELEELQCAMLEELE